MSSFGSPVSEYRRHCPEETTSPWHCSVDRLHAVYLVPATQLSQLLPFPSGSLRTPLAVRVDLGLEFVTVSPSQNQVSVITVNPPWALVLFAAGRKGG